MGYGLRWMAETSFSTFKRLCGDYMAINMGSIAGELAAKAGWKSPMRAYNPVCLNKLMRNRVTMYVRVRFKGLRKLLSSRMIMRLPRVYSLMFSWKNKGGIFFLALWSLTSYGKIGTEKVKNYGCSKSIYEI
jgi:hypothetical protein